MPAPQLVQPVALAAAPYLPEAQGRQADAAGAAANLPTSQPEQPVSAPVVFEKVPLGQEMQLVDPVLKA